MLDALVHLDQTLTLAINGSHSLWLDGFALAVTATITWLPAALVLIYVIIRHGEMKEILLTILAIGLCILLADQIASGLFKPLVARPRPTQDALLMLRVDVVGDYRGGAYGFFSSHAANTFAVATFVGLLIRHRLLGLMMTVWALLNCWSRIYLGVHYLGDVLVGICCGILVGWLVYWGFCRFIPRSERQVGIGAVLQTHSGFALKDVMWLNTTLVILFIYCTFKGLLFAA